MQSWTGFSRKTLSKYMEHCTLHVQDACEIQQNAMLSQTCLFAVTL